MPKPAHAVPVGIVGGFTVAFENHVPAYHKSRKEIENAKQELIEYESIRDTVGDDEKHRALLRAVELRIKAHNEKFPDRPYSP